MPAPRAVGIALLTLALGSSCSPAAPISNPPPPEVRPRADAPCALAAKERARVPALSREGKLNCALRVLDVANALCPVERASTWRTELELLAEIGRTKEARELLALITRDDPAADTARVKALLDEAEAPIPDVAAAMREMNREFDEADLARDHDQPRAAEQHFLAAWRAYRPNGAALFGAGRAAKDVAKDDPEARAEAQRLFDRAMVELRSATHHDVRVEVPNGLRDASVIAWAPKGTILAVADVRTIRLMSTSTWRERVRLEGHTGEVTALAFSRDGKILASGGRDSAVRFWDVATGNRLREITEMGAPITSVAFSPDGETVAVGRIDEVVRIFDATTGAMVRAFEGNGTYVPAVSFSPDGKTLACASFDRQIPPLRRRRAARAPRAGRSRRRALVARLRRPRPGARVGLGRRHGAALGP